MWGDLRAAVRGLRRAPGFSLLVVLVLALGIGVYSVTQATRTDAARGRLFTPDESRDAGAASVVVLTDASGHSALGADPAALGRALRLGGRPYTFVGVLPPGFSSVDLKPADRFAPLAAGTTLSYHGERSRDPQTKWLTAVARLAPGADPRGAAAVASGLLHAVDLAHPQSALGFGATLPTPSVAQRASEFGVRMALGARGRDVAALVLGQGLRTVALGGAAGALGAVVVGRLLRAKLYGVGPLDPVSLGVTAAVLAGAALLAGWLPARRAARIDPASALRSE